MPHRKSRIPDFAFMINKLVKDGMGVKEIADFLETHGTVVTKIRTEAKDLPTGWASSYYLIDLYIRKYGRPIPFFGDHNE